MSVEETSFALLRAAAFPICCVSQPSAFSVIRVYKEERIDSKSLDPVSSGRQFLVIDQPNNGKFSPAFFSKSTIIPWHKSVASSASSEKKKQAKHFRVQLSHLSSQRTGQINYLSSNELTA